MVESTNNKKNKKNKGKKSEPAPAEEKKTTQLPVPESTPLLEETKTEPSVSVFPTGSQEDFVADVKRKLEGVDLNALELGLLERYLSDQETCAANVVGLLKKLEAKHVEKNNRYELKRIRKVIPLFDEHDFWSTQPVPKYYEQVDASTLDQPIEIKKVSDVQKDPYDLPKGYRWVNVDLNDEEQLQELYTLLMKHYVEDSEGKFRFDYSTDFLRWALNPPHNFPDWLVGVADEKDPKKLYAFISGIPVNMVVNGKHVTMAEINFLCAHKKLRSLRLAPLLIKEVTRRVNLKDIWQAVYTSGTTLPTPFSAAPYWHRNLNPRKLIDVKFAYKPQDQPMARFISAHRLPAETETPGLRDMKESDVVGVTAALNKHLYNSYKVHITFTEEEVAHFFLPRNGVIQSSLIQGDDGEITDFISFYTLNSTIIGHMDYDKLHAAYAFYNFTVDNNPERLKALFRDMLIIAKKREFDVFNMTEVMKYKNLTNELMFKPGDGLLAHYLYNWRIKSIEPSDIGIVLV